MRDDPAHLQQCELGVHIWREIRVPTEIRRVDECVVCGERAIH